MLIDPQWRGSLLYDLHTALIWKANRKFASEKSPEAKREFLDAVKSVQTMLHTSIKCLEHEEKTSKEGSTCANARKALAALKDIALFIDFL